MSDEELTQRLLIHLAVLKDLVEAAVAVGKLELEAERGQRGHLARRAEEGAAQLKEGVWPGEDGLVGTGAERDERIGRGGDHLR